MSWRIMWLDKSFNWPYLVERTNYELTDAVSYTQAHEYNWEQGRILNGIKFAGNSAIVCRLVLWLILFQSAQFLIGPRVAPLCAYRAL